MNDDEWYIFKLQLCSYNKHILLFVSVPYTKYLSMKCNISSISIICLLFTFCSPHATLILHSSSFKLNQLQLCSQSSQKSLIFFRKTLTFTQAAATRIPYLGAFKMAKEEIKDYTQQGFSKLKKE